MATMALTEAQSSVFARPGRKSTATKEQVEQIRTKISSGEPFSFTALAREYGVSCYLVLRIYYDLTKRDKHGKN